MSEFVANAQNLRLGRIVLKSLALACSVVQAFAWRDVIDITVEKITPFEDDSLAEAIVNAVVVTGFSVFAVVIAYRVVACTERARVEIH